MGADLCLRGCRPESFAPEGERAAWVSCADMESESVRLLEKPLVRGAAADAEDMRDRERTWEGLDERIDWEEVVRAGLAGVEVGSWEAGAKKRQATTRRGVCFAGSEVRIWTVETRLKDEYEGLLVV